MIRKRYLPPQINADGKADFLHIAPSTGQVRAWLNSGASAPPFFNSTKSHIWHSGADRGQNIHVPKLRHRAAADYHRVLPKTAQAFT
jgi:hypothetical protein